MRGIAEHSVVFVGPEGLTVGLPSVPPVGIREKRAQAPFLVYSLSSLVRQMAPAYDYDRFADFVCQRVLPDIDSLAADNGLLVVLCHDNETRLIPLAVWGGVGQIARFSIILCMVSADTTDTFKRIEMPAAYKAKKFAAIACGSCEMERIANKIISFVRKSPWGISLPLLMSELGD